MSSGNGFTRIYHLLYIDISDTLRPPGLDVLVVLLAILGAVLVSIQPITSPVTASSTVLDPTLFAATLFLAIRSSAGLAVLIQGGVMNVYLSHPIPKAIVAIILLTSRVLIPSALILAVPLVTAVVLLGPTLYKGLDVILGSYIANLFQALLYGGFFILLAARVRSQATSGILSVASYFTYIALQLILLSVGEALNNKMVREFGRSMSLPDIVYLAYLGLEYEIWQLMVVPALATISITLYLLYFSRRFEVI